MVLKNKKIVITGGGSGGHTIPALVMIHYWKAQKIRDIFYFGSHHGIERSIVTAHVDKYFIISTGKLRRYLSIENFLDFFRFLKGIIQSFFQLIRIKPDVVFSTGGFVALPVVIASKLLGIRVVIHEQTTHVGLANKISSYFAQAICISFESSASYFPAAKTFYTGYPLRSQFYQPIKKLTSFQGKLLPSDKKLLLILGGGNGSVLLNTFVKNNWQLLCDEFAVVLQTGKAFEQEFKAIVHPNLWTFSFLQDEMIELMETADYVIARAGAGTVCELIHLKKICMFIPLAIAQKNEQWHNAQAAHKKIGSSVIREDEWKQLSVSQVTQLLKIIPDPKQSNLGQQVPQKNASAEIHRIVF